MIDLFLFLYFSIEMFFSTMVRILSKTCFLQNKFITNCIDYIEK